MLNKYIGLNLGLGILILILGFAVRWLGIPAGNLIDWSIGIISFWWLLIITTIPWNIYFDARETLTETKISQHKELKIEPNQVNYVQQVARWSIIGAIALHLVSAIALYVLAATGISNVGYISSLFTLLLTFLRPTLRAYQYLYNRLSTIKQEVKYPREDAIKLHHQVTSLAAKLEKIERMLDLENEDSLICQQQQKTQENHHLLLKLTALLEEDRIKNQIAREKIAQEAKNAISQLNEDSQFLNHVREIVRFVKTA